MSPSLECQFLGSLVSVRLTEAVCAAALAVLGGGFEWIIADILGLFVAGAVGQKLRCYILYM